MKSHTPSSLGADLRALRKARGMTLDAMATGLGKSVGWCSQIERDISHPTIADLEAISALFGVPRSLFFVSGKTAPGEEGLIVRAGSRRQVGERSGGLVEALLSPDLTDDFEVVHSTFLPGAELADTVTRPTQELGYLVSGRLTLWIDGTEFDIRAGDAFRIRGTSYRWANPHADPAVAVWVIAPPVY